MVKNDGSRTTLGRGFRLGKLGLTLTGSYIGYQFQNLFMREETRGQRRRLFQQKASRRVREELESLKGPVMKLGQLLSAQTHVLPKEAILELANLQMRAPGMHPTLARAQFKNSLGKYPEEVFREFEAEPFAAASLGQVHRAMTKRGERVAVKIQYPAIRTAIENDFKLLRSATFPGRISGHLPVSILNEVQRGFMEETDYLNEGKNLDFFRDGLARFNYLSIPQVHWDLTTDRVLTMSFVDGAPVAEFMKGKPPRAIRDLIGHRIFELFHFQIQCLGALHADPHPGNFLFQSDGRIGLVDFGCVKRLTFDVVDLCRCCVERAWREGDERAAHVCRLIWPQTPFPKARRMLSSLDKMADILFPDTKGAEPLVDFGEPALLNTITRCLTESVRHKLTNPEFAFTSRSDLGLYSLLHQLKATVNTREIWRQVSEQAAKMRRKAAD
jgi:predicted unusual protein kinase regulating ubiquinone biosynthesis (AarF/ABC1/UbiB family)